MFFSDNKDDDTTGLTLQQAFTKHRQDFIAKSQQHKAEAKVKAKQKEIKIKEKEVKNRQKVKQHGQLTNTLASWKKSRGLNAPPNRGN